MKLCDIHTHIGHWPFRKLPFTDVKSLLLNMDRLGIEKSVVCNTHSVFYKNTQSGNEELFEATKKHRDRLLPAATLNPLYVGAKEDLLRCREEFGFRILRLVPTYHDYELDDERAVELAMQAVDLGMAVLIPRLMVDIRQKHRLDVENTVALDSVIDFAGKLKKGTVIGVEFPVQNDSRTIRRLVKTTNIYFGITRIPYLNRRVLPELLGKLGPERFLFASGMPFKTPEPAVLKLLNIHDPSMRSKVGSENFLRLFQDS